MEESTLNLAYTLALKSYDQLLQRADAWDGHLDRIITWGFSLNAAIITIVAGVLSKGNIPRAFTVVFWLAVILLCLTCIVGFIGRLRGTLMLTNPATIGEAEWMNLAPGDFKKYIVEDSGKHYKSNTSYVNKKASFATASTMGFVIVAALLIIWAASLSV